MRRGKPDPRASSPGSRRPGHGARVTARPCGSGPAGGSRAGPHFAVRHGDASNVTRPPSASERRLWPVPVRVPARQPGPGGPDRCEPGPAPQRGRIFGVGDAGTPAKRTLQRGGTEAALVKTWSRSDRRRGASRGDQTVTTFWPCRSHGPAGPGSVGADRTVKL